MIDWLVDCLIDWLVFGSVGLIRSIFYKYMISLDDEEMILV